MTGALLDWYDRNRRALPWRSQRTGYRVWVAEVMLQQTQVATAIPYFQRWLRRFPTVDALAASPLDEVLRAWEGLGYYRRARNLHRAATTVCADHGGRLPRSAAELETLPGIGPYTAAAIASIAFGEPVVAVDANVRRVGARLFGLASPSNREIAARLERYLDPTRPGDVNEALMDLGSSLCLTRTPRCEHCPLAARCAALASGEPGALPRRKPRSPRPLRRRYALVWLDRGRVFLQQRPAEVLLPGLWGFVQRERLPAGATPLQAIEHGYTHFRLTLTPVLVTGRPGGDGAMIASAELGELALSRVDRKVLALLNSEGLLACASPAPGMVDE